MEQTTFTLGELNLASQIQSVS